MKRLATIIAIGLPLCLAVGPARAADDPATTDTFNDVQFGFSITYPDHWLLKNDRATLDNLGGSKEKDKSLAFEFLLFARSSPSAKPSGSNLLGGIALLPDKFDPTEILAQIKEGLASGGGSVEGPTPLKIGTRDFYKLVLTDKKPSAETGGGDLQEHYVYLDGHTHRLFDFIVTAAKGSKELANLETVMESLRFKNSP